ncbi:hypothetical protein KIW84_052023, partial [Lathyrus oleraceus]
KSSTAMSHRHRLRLRILRKVDRISDLPNSLLEHILSFLPTKDTIATSILSKRWKPIWVSQLVFYLDGTSLQDTFAFRRFFNSFITTRDNITPYPSSHSTLNLATTDTTTTILFMLHLPEWSKP